MYIIYVCISIPNPTGNAILLSKSFAVRIIVIHPSKNRNTQHWTHICGAGRNKTDLLFLSLLLLLLLISSPWATRYIPLTLQCRLSVRRACIQSKSAPASVSLLIASPAPGQNAKPQKLINTKWDIIYSISIYIYEIYECVSVMAQKDMLSINWKVRFVCKAGHHRTSGYNRRHQRHWHKRWQW